MDTHTLTFILDDLYNNICPDIYVYMYHPDTEIFFYCTCIYIYIYIALHCVSGACRTGYFLSVGRSYSPWLFLACVLAVVAVTALSNRTADSVSVQAMMCSACDYSKCHRLLLLMYSVCIT